MQRDSGGQTLSRACPEALSNSYASFLGRHFPRKGSEDDVHKPSSLSAGAAEFAYLGALFAVSSPIYRTVDIMRIPSTSD